MKMRLFLALTMLVMSVSAVRAEYNEKFVKKACEEVWGMDLPAFDAKKSIPKDLSKDQKAVYIAKYDLIDADYAQEANMSMQSNPMGSNTYSITILKVIRREMVKLLDQKAVEDFSEIKLEGDSELKIRVKEITKMQYAVGARIHKASGAVADVDFSQALTDLSKRAEDDQSVPSLPVNGLEVGDVLDFFTYELTEIIEMSPGIERFSIIDRYPILNYQMAGKFSPKLTVEYRSYNGAPELSTAVDDKGNNIAGISIENIPGRAPIKWFLPERQMPYYRVNVLNNTATMVWHPKGARPAGLYSGVLAPTYYSDLAESLVKAGPEPNLLKHVQKYMKEYMKEHPDEKTRSYIDRTWAATVYYTITSSDVQVDPWLMSMTFATALRKLKLNDQRIGVGFVNPRNSIATEDLMSSLDIAPLVVVGDSIYHVNNCDECAPGEVPGAYQGETGAAFFSDLTDKYNKHTPEPITLPTSNANANVSTNQLKVKINANADSYPVTFDRSVRNIGNEKVSSQVIIEPKDIAASLEDYLGIPENDRYKPKEKDAAEQQQKIEKAMLDEAEQSIGVRPSKITSWQISSLGISPKAKPQRYTMQGEIEGLVTNVGNNELLFSVGKLFGKNVKLEDTERVRDVEAVFESPFQTIHSLEVEVPDGYHVDPAAIEALNTSVSNPVGSFNVTVQLSEDAKTVMFTMKERINTYVVPVDNWNDLLALIDASAAFSEVGIVFTK